MKTLLIGINAKYIHPCLAIRLLKKNTTYHTDIKEYTIKDKIEDIYNYIIDNKYTIVAFSCYIWNIEIIKKLLLLLKDKKLTIILGGPEVSYNAEYYINNGLANYAIKNEGEEAFNLLLHYIDNKYELNKIPNLYHRNGFTYDKLVDLNNIKMAYDLLDDLNNKIIYLETSRGCPYKCGYCMASLDNKVRFFNIEAIKEQILALTNKGARTFKFLDRTFNANKNNFLSLIDYIIDIHKDYQSYQFEITGDLLSDEIIDYINAKAPKNLFRFEIGIQSTNIKTNLSVGRIQDNVKLFDNIKRIQDAEIIDLHLDLIAGLPYEDYKSFENTFNEVLLLKPKELQLGFLKLLHGTRLKNEAHLYNYKWDNNAPYEVFENDYLSVEDIKEIHLAEDSFETYYNTNYMKNTMNIILNNEENPFDFFNKLGKTNYKHQPLEYVFKNIDDFVKNKNYYNSFHQQIIVDYLNYYNLKPKAWWNEKCDKTTKNNILRSVYEKYLNEFMLTDLFKYSMVINLDGYYIIAIYMPNNKKIIKIKK